MKTPLGITCGIEPYNYGNVYKFTINCKSSLCDHVFSPRQNFVILCPWNSHNTQVHFKQFHAHFSLLNPSTLFHMQNTPTHLLHPSIHPISALLSSYNLQHEAFLHEASQSLRFKITMYFNRLISLSGVLSISAVGFQQFQTGRV